MSEETVITLAELLALPEYSLSLPTGTTLGYRWRKCTSWHDPVHSHWKIGEYVEHPDPKFTGIVWTLAVSAPGMPYVGVIDPNRADPTCTGCDHVFVFADVCRYGQLMDGRQGLWCDTCVARSGGKSHE